MSKRFLTFTSLSLAGMFVVSIMLIQVFREINQNTLERHFQEHNVILARILRNGLVNTRMPEMLNGDKAINKDNGLWSTFERELREYLKDVPVAKIKIFDVSGITIFSSAPGEAGRDASSNPGVYGALNGLSTGSMVYRDRFNSFDGIIENRNLYQQYIPIHGRSDDQVEGVFEIYSDVTPLLKSIADREDEFLLGLFAVLSVFLAAQIWLYHRTNSALVREQAQTDRYLHELEGNKEELETRVRVRTEELESSRYFLQSIIDGIANPLFVIKKNLKISLMNKAAKGLISKDTPRERMSYCYQISHRRDTPCSGVDHPCSFEEVMKSQSTVTVQHNHFDADDNPIIVDVISTPLYDRDGELQGIIEVQHDITELVNAKQNMAESEARLQAILDHIPDAIFTLSNGHIESSNQAAVLMFRHEQDELVGAHFNSLFCTEEEALLDDPDQGVRELCALREANDRFPVDLWVGDILLGTEQRVVAVVRDITERKIAAQEIEKTRQQYYHQEKMAAIGQLAAGILHEVGNPIAAIAGAAHDMRSANEWSGRQTEMQEEYTHIVDTNLKMIEEHTDRLAKITRDIADFASPRTRQRELSDINGLIRSTTRLLGYDHRFRGMELKHHLDPQLPAIEVVPDQITQVLMNLIINSLDATASSRKEKAIVEVVTRIAEGGIEIEIKDSGVGMDESTLEHALEPFFTTKEPGKGTGLGLSLCSSIVSSHEGRLLIDSLPGVGTSVIVFLPAMDTLFNHAYRGS
ncbi:MAG: ATP-binding protein [Candidatus Thiodiazotropha sp. (ex. Lucinoma kazani)]